MLNLILYTNKMKISAILFIQYYILDNVHNISMTLIKITLIKLQNLEKIIHIMLIH